MATIRSTHIAFKSLETASDLTYGGAMADVTQSGYHRGRIPASKGKTYPAEILTPEDIRAPAAQCSTTSNYGIRHRALIVFLYRTGLRISEAFALRLFSRCLVGGVSSSHDDHVRGRGFLPIGIANFRG